MMAGASGYDGKLLDAIEFAVKECGINFVLKNQQVEAIHSIVTGRDVFVKAATGFGKSICYVLLPYVCDHIYRSTTASNSSPSFSSIVILVSPLTALMDDQIKTISSFGIRCKKLHEGPGKDDSADVGEGKYQILIMSLESFALKEIRSVLLKLQGIVCLAIDEAHCVLQWLVHVLFLF